MARGSKLDEYDRKRDFGKTAEPAPKKPRRRKGAPRFVVQEHSATRLHWDLRLEHEGVGVSWAVPNGIPHDPAENRKAVHTEDHPLEYFSFEGEIPKGEYGAGTMRIWDRGTYEAEKWRDDEIILRFDGERLRGRYVLFRAGGAEGLDDPPDGPARGGARALPRAVPADVGERGRTAAIDARLGGGARLGRGAGARPLPAGAARPPRRRPRRDRRALARGAPPEPPDRRP